MYEVVNASNLFAIIFSISNKNYVSCKDVVGLRNSIESNFPGILINVSRNSVLGAQRRYPYLFKMQSSNIWRTRDFSTLPKKYLENEFFNQIGADAVTKISGIVRKEFVQRANVR